NREIVAVRSSQLEVRGSRFEVRGSGSRIRDSSCGLRTSNFEQRTSSRELRSAIYSALMLDDITQAVLAREDVARYLRGGHGQTEPEARARIPASLDELRTTQRYPIYRALKHPLYPILRKIERLDEHVAIAEQATRAGRVIYISNHKSHLDYLVEPLV